MNKKILLFCICLSAGVSAAAFADRIVDPLRLPKSIQNYVQQCFPNDAVTLAESDWGVYEVYLESGAKIEFTLSRKWEEITSASGIPATALPAGVADAVEQRYPGASVIQIERHWRGYEAKLNNGMEVYFSKDGRLIGHKYDD